MLYPFRLISEEALPVGRDQSGAPPLARLLRLLRDLSGLFDTAPAVLALPGSAVLTFLYRDVAYPWRDVMAAAGPAAAGLADSLPLRFFGTTQARETAELTARREGEAVLVRLRSVSGRPIQRLEGLGLQARLPDAETAAQIAEIAASGPFLAPCGVVKRHCEALDVYKRQETGFMTCHEELMKLIDPDYQEKLAQGIAKGIADYLSTLPAKTDNPSPSPKASASSQASPAPGSDDVVLPPAA